MNRHIWCFRCNRTHERCKKHEDRIIRRANRERPCVHTRIEPSPLPKGDLNAIEGLTKGDDQLLRVAG
jgi:hypothetical protein